MLNHRTQELERLKSDWSARTTTLVNEHSAALTTAKEKAIEVRDSERRDSERRERERDELFIINISLLLLLLLGYARGSKET